jgi:IS30 family transposase
MAVRQPRYSKEEFARRGDEIYESQVRQQIDEISDRGKIVAIDIETGHFEVDANEIAACERLEVRHPEAQIWMVRIGSRHVRRFGGRTKKAMKKLRENLLLSFLVFLVISVFSCYTLAIKAS